MKRTAASKTKDHVGVYRLKPFNPVNSAPLAQVANRSEVGAQPVLSTELDPLGPAKAGVIKPPPQPLHPTEFPTAPAGNSIASDAMADGMERSQRQRRAFVAGSVPALASKRKIRGRRFVRRVLLPFSSVIFGLELRVSPGFRVSDFGLGRPAGRSASCSPRRAPRPGIGLDL